MQKLKPFENCLRILLAPLGNEGLRVGQIFDGFQMHKYIFPYFLAEENFMWNLTEMVSYFSKRL